MYQSVGFMRWRLLALGTCIVASTFLGGTGCDEETPETDEPQKPKSPPTQDTGSSGPSEETVEKTEKQAVGLAVSRFDRARFISSNLEAARQPDEPSQPAAPDPGPARGSLQPEQLQKVFARHNQEMQSCYERQLKKNSNLSGSAVLQITIDTDGSVRRAKVAGGTLRSDAVYGCLEQNAEGWTFPEPSGGMARVRKPFSFSPSQ